MSGWRRVRIRILDYDKPELYCYGCREWYPLTMEFWPHQSNTSECRACARERARLYQAKLRFDPEHRLKAINKSRAYREFLKNEHPELLAAYKRELEYVQLDGTNRRRGFQPNRRPRTLEEQRAYNRVWMREHRAKKKAA